MADTVLCHFGLFFALLPPNNTKNQNCEKLKKVHGDIIIFQKCTKNHDHMLYRSLDMVRNRCSRYFSFWAIFCPFTSVTAQKLIFKKMRKKKKEKKKRLEISSFYINVLKIMIICYIVPEI